MNISFKLPTITYEQLKKIIMNSDKRDKNAIIDREELSKLTSINSDTISRNNAFLYSIGLIEKNDNNKYIITEKGIKLAKAYKQENDFQIQKMWVEIIMNNEDLSDFMYSQEYKKNLHISDFLTTIMKCFPNQNISYSRTGANTLLEIFKDAKLLNIEDETILEFYNINYIYRTISEEEKNYLENKPISIENNTHNISITREKLNNYNININININYETEKHDEIIKEIKNIINELKKGE
ncbi:hypothetical protein NEI00_00220 [Brachyspira pilosicoli]|uniref:hypothetical protein n=1 Tax=Brachyspira pilosicoli TaxID=52584 RepID=UPI002542BA02|nr:hypothetical protein [Brachyspira pilosicoli]WIH83622.1 hypothetical protein NEI00_00220 [Brachyspira pilosicoli]